MKALKAAVLVLAAFVFVSSSWAWDPRKDDEDKAAEAQAEIEELDTKSQEAIAALKKKDPDIQAFFDQAAAYVVIPTVGKGGLGIGGARGTGLLYENGAPVAKVTLTQVTIGLQAGGQAYSEFLFFEDAIAVEDFKRSNYELGAQASAVAVETGASADVDYNSGIAIFTMAKGGLMAEASVGGQKFKVEAL